MEPLAKRKKVVLLDFDGTVINTMKEYAVLASELISKYTGMNKDLAYKLYLETAGMDFPSQLKYIGIDGSLAKKIYIEFVEGKRNIVKSKEISQHAKTFVLKLKELGIRSSLSTNNECELVNSINGIEIFDLVLCFDGISFRKGTQHIEKLMNVFGIGKDEIVFIGDSDYDIKVYSSIGISSIKTSGLFSEEEVERLLNIISRDD